MVSCWLTVRGWKSQSWDNGDGSTVHSLETLIPNWVYLLTGMLKKAELLQNPLSSIGQFIKVTHSRKIFWSQQIKSLWTENPSPKLIASFRNKQQEVETFLVWPRRSSHKAMKRKWSRRKQKSALSWKAPGQQNNLCLSKRRGGSPNTASGQTGRSIKKTSHDTSSQPKLYGKFLKSLKYAKIQSSFTFSWIALCRLR